MAITEIKSLGISSFKASKHMNNASWNKPYVIPSKSSTIAHLQTMTNQMINAKQAMDTNPSANNINNYLWLAYLHQVQRQPAHKLNYQTQNTITNT
jgi:hypothetical protein